MWSVHGFGITLVVLLGYSEVQARFVPDTTTDESTEQSVGHIYKFLDQVSVSKMECVLKFIEKPDADLDCVDKFFSDEQAQFLLDELAQELARNLPTEEGAIKGDHNDDEDDDQLVADLNTLSEKAGRLSTVNDDVPMINSNKNKRVEEQVNIPKEEEQRNGENNQENVAEVVKSDDEIEIEEDPKHQNDVSGETDYDYEVLVSKLYNMLQDLIMKETIDYGLNMGGDDDDSNEEQSPNLDTNAIATEEHEEDNENEMVGNKEENENFLLEGGDQQNENDAVGGDSEKEETNEEELVNFKVDDKIGDVEGDEIEKELKQVQGTQTDYNEDPRQIATGAEVQDSESNNVVQIENDLVQELDQMLSLARQAVADDEKSQVTSDAGILSNDKFLKDLRNMEKVLKKSVDQ